PLVDQLINLWKGIDLSKTFEHPNGKIIKGVIIYYSYNIPVARKLCGFISAKITYHRYLKHANFDDKKQTNFGKLDNINS
ncbi:183_t:CDS:1, partial [Funneliformis caledonium]